MKAAMVFKLYPFESDRDCTDFIQTIMDWFDSHPFEYEIKLRSDRVAVLLDWSVDTKMIRELLKQDGIIRYAHGGNDTNWFIGKI